LRLNYLPFMESQFRVCFFLCFSEEFLSWLDSKIGGVLEFWNILKNMLFVFIGLAFVMYSGKQGFGFETYLFIRQ